MKNRSGDKMNQAKQGLMADIWVKKEKKKENKNTKATGKFIGDLDFFEKQKHNIMQSFRDYTIDDDIYILSHKDHLM